MSTVLAATPAPAELAGAVDEAYGEFCRGYGRLLAAIAEHDRYEAYRAIGLRKEQDYLCRTFDVRWHTAKDWTREARLIGAHPEIGDRLASGKLSIDRFRKMAEVVDEQSPESVRPKGPFDDERGGAADPDPGPNPDPSPSPDPGPNPDPGPSPDPRSDSGSEEPTPDEPGSLTLAHLMAMLEEMTARQLAAKAAAARAEAARQRERWRTRHLDVIRSDGEGRVSVKGGELYDDAAAVVWAAFEDYANRVGKNPETGTWDPLGRRYADALRAMADAYLARRERDLGHPIVVFHADARVLTDDATAWAAVGADHSPLSVDSIRRLACFSKINMVLDDPNGNPLFLGRTQRLASWQQEYTVIWRDGACRGCGATVGLEVHHLREWTAECGSTDVDRLIAACRTCHHLQHDGRWRFEGDPNGEICFRDPMGNARCRTRPHPRFGARPRPPKDWHADPPRPADDPNGASRPPDPPDPPDPPGPASGPSG